TTSACALLISVAKVESVRSSGAFMGSLLLGLLRGFGIVGQEGVGGHAQRLGEFQDGRPSRFVLGPLVLGNRLVCNSSSPAQLGQRDTLGFADGPEPLPESRRRVVFLGHVEQHNDPRRTYSEFA